MIPLSVLAVEYFRMVKVGRLLDTGCWRKVTRGVVLTLVFDHYGDCENCPLKEQCYSLQRDAYNKKARTDLELMEAKNRNIEAMIDIENIERGRIGT